MKRAGARLVRGATNDVALFGSQEEYLGTFWCWIGIYGTTKFYFTLFRLCEVGVGIQGVRGPGV